MQCIFAAVNADKRLSKGVKYIECERKRKWHAVSGIAMAGI